MSQAHHQSIFIYEQPITTQHCLGWSSIDIRCEQVAIGVDKSLNGPISKRCTPENGSVNPVSAGATVVVGGVGPGAHAAKNIAAGQAL